MPLTQLASFMTIFRDYVGSYQERKPALDGLVVRVVAFGTEGRRFESTKGYTPDQTCRETTGEFAPHCKPRDRAVAPPRVGPDP